MDRWMVFIVSQFVSATLGFLWGVSTGNLLFIYIGGLFFAIGVFAVTRWGYDRFFRRKDKDRDKKGGGERRRGGGRNR
ncbi:MULTISPECIES: hypothetical protein [Candidatus Nitrosocaldus]|jgi:hypothetical protein|uniref:Uncharacterized protein n=1 Tax=Candidatus Nitrosocaldus cavascurensis TaxID=2058097 RepID=A0A2K5AQC8_9ARCH|nr:MULTISPECIES: hypothetical protein [Candidatus Nitrosocaldus]SPC33852.1 conserved protein of unknown function [Candidatus Nitrosocaldus cavascurensis]